MATKYTRPDPPESHRARDAHPAVRMLRYSTAPPSRRALTWIIVGTALIVTLLMVVSELSSHTPQTEYQWIEGTVISNEASILRVEFIDDDDSTSTYDISVDGHPNLETLSPDDAVRIQVETDETGAIARIIRVEPVLEATAPLE